MIEKFLLDSNAFITPYKQYYSFDLVPSFWEEMSKQITAGRIILLDLVQEEIMKGKDDLAKWLLQQTGITVCKHNTIDIINEYQEIIQYVRDCGYYNNTAFWTWAPEQVADSWLIAAAATNGYTIITLERSANNLNEKTPQSKIKIPDVAKHFGVKTNNIFYMMQQLGIKI